MLRVRRPPHIFRLVIPVFIWVSIEAVPLARTLAHVGKEIGKAMPAVANTNASSTVKRIIFIAKIVTPVHHARPKAVERMLITSDRKTMAFVPKGRALLIKASAGLDLGKL